MCAAAMPTRNRPELEFVPEVSDLLKEAVYELSLTLVLYEADDLRDFTRSPIRARLVRRVPGWNQVRSGSPPLELALSRRARIAHPRSLPTD